MKSFRNLAPLLSCAAIPFLPLTASAWEPPLVSATANADGNYGIPANVDTATAAGGSVSAHAVQPSYNVVATTDAKAKAGSLFGHVRSDDDDGYYYASGTTDSRWRDIVTINASGKKGQTGLATLNYMVTSTSSFESNDGNCRTEVSASATVQNGSIWSLGRRTTTYPDGSFLGDQYFGAVQSLDFYFTYGEPFQLTVALNTSSGTSGSGGGVGFADVDANLIWMGFTNVRASDTVTRVSNPRVISDSDTNYVHPIGVSFPWVTIRATPTEITEKQEQLSTVTVSLSKPAPTGLRVELAYAGTATIKSDYATLRPTHVYISKGSTQETFTIRAKNDGLVEPREKVSIRLLPGIGYGVGSANAANVMILSDD